MDTTFLLNNILKSDGTNQNQRLLPALDPDFIKVDERGLKDLLSFAYGLSKQIKFFPLDNNPDGNWDSFFNYFVDPVTGEILLTNDEILTLLQTKSDFDPSFALFVAFLQLLVFAQNDINNITKSHLDFYYKEILQLLPKPPVADKAHLILELAKNLSNDDIGPNTPFKAAKDASGFPIYQSDTEIVINRAQIQNIRSTFISYNQSTNNFVIYAASAANSADGNGKPFAITGSKWSAFGEDQSNKTTGEQNMQEASLGFGLASPMLFLEGGERLITLTIQFNDIPEEEFFSGDISDGVQILFSGAKDWIKPKSFTAVVNATRLSPPNNTLFSCNLIITASLATADPAVVAYDASVLDDVFNTQWPVMKMMLTSGSYLYGYLYNLIITSGTIEVAVTGVKNLVLQNDLSQLSADKPFQPFGPIPAIGSDFYIGSAEIFQKKLTDFNINLLWGGVPQPNIGEYYVSYFDATTSLANVIFTACISLLYNGQWVPLKNEGNLPTGDYFLFNINDATAVNNIINNKNALDAAFSGLSYERDTQLQQLTSLDNNTHNGFVKIEITGPDAGYTFKAFGQNEFPGIYAKRAIQIALGDSTKVLPNTPYTPLIKSVSLDYVSVQNIDFTDGNSPEQFFHIEPFGSARVYAENPYLLPQYRNESALPLSRAQSALYLGNMYLAINNLVPPQNLSILFQVAEGSAGIDSDMEDEDISWFYLADNKWIPLSTLDIITNTTNGLQTPGIVSFSIGEDASNNNTLFPAGFYWLRASVTKNPSEVNEFIDIKAQAVEVRYVLPADNSIADLHLSQPLPPFSIKELLVKDSAIKSVTQPYISFGGSDSEQDNAFYTRISERLRHKKRALDLWDYERLILDGFLEIFKVKCLTHTDETTDIAPGTVSAIVVPDLINKNSADPLQPKVNLITLQNIEAYIYQYVPLFVNFNADNPVYEQLFVDFKVGFLPGKDAGYYGNFLNEEIKRFLSPWAYEEGQDITFGGKVFKSDIIIFIENRPYVDFVNSFNLYHIFDGVDQNGPGIGTMAIGTDFIIGEDFIPAIGDMEIDNDFVVGRDTEVAIASDPRSILVSAPNHRIRVLKAGEYTCQGAGSLGIGFMIIGENFIVGS